MRTLVALVCALGLTACGSGPGDDDDGATLVVLPETASLTVVNGDPVAQPYTAILRHPDGSERDVTDEVVFSIAEAHVGSFSAGAPTTLLARGAGRGTVAATLDDRQGFATVEVFARGVRVEPSAPPGAPGLFDGAADDPGRLAEIVYPSPRTIVPPNLGDFDLHWRDGTGSDLFELRLSTYYADVRVYLGADAAAGAWQTFLPAEWALIARSEVGATIDVRVRGLTQAAPGTASRAELRVHASREDIVGGLYYWAAASSTGPAGIYRHDMSRPGEPAEQFYTTAQTPGGRCVACHAVSRDGTRMAVTYDGGNGAANVLDVASRTAMMGSDDAWNFASFSPDAAKLLVVRQGALSLRDPASGAVIAPVPTTSYSTHPDFSPIGDRIVYVSAATPGADWHFTGGTIITRTYRAADDTFGDEVELVASAENNFYPSLSPDGQWVLFNRSGTSALDHAYDNANAQLWLVKIDGSVGPLRLDQANLGPGLTNSWARWAPFEGTYGDAAEPIYWLTFSSKRDFGVRLVGANRPQVWMTPFFPGRAAAGQDPTAPAFRLPFQDLDSNNHIAQWTEEVVPIQ
jgi:hypothetical protein